MADEKKKRKTIKRFNIISTKFTNIIVFLK